MWSKLTLIKVRDGSSTKGSTEHFMDHNIFSLTLLVSQKFKLLSIILEFTLTPYAFQQNVKPAILAQLKEERKREFKYGI